MHALLALAIAASADERDPESYKTFQRRVDQFIADMQAPMAAAADDWHRGYELHRAMHRVFFNGEQTELGSYDFNQPRVTGIFTHGRYNCLSSAILFVVLARGFGLPVRAVFVPSHVFVEMGPPGGKAIEIETTSSTGFDWIHDGQFYSEKAAQWARNRGLPVTTLAQYQARTIVEPYRMVAHAMRGTLPNETESDRVRLNELAAFVDPDDIDLQRARIQTYASEANKLINVESWPTLVRLLDGVEPAVSEVGTRSKDPKTLELIAWLNSDYVWALFHVGRYEQSVALARSGVEHLDRDWPDAGKLRDNYVGLLVRRMSDLTKAKEFLALAAFSEAIAPTVSSVAAKTTEAKTLEQVSWLRWGHAWALVQTGRPEPAMAIVRDGVGHLDPSWLDAERLKESYASVLTQHIWALYQSRDFRAIVVAFGKDSVLCRADVACLATVGGAFVSLAVTPMNAGDWQTARQILLECVAALPLEARCIDTLKDLESRHRF
jgi:hypothetical protein